MCSVESCDKLHYGRGFCRLHLRRWMKHGDPLREGPQGCSVEGCAEAHYGRGYCTLHHKRWFNHGDPLWHPATLKQRFWAKVDKTDGCWLWTGATNGVDPARDPDPDHLYGSFNVGDGKWMLPHRFAYELLVGPIPDGLQLDHRYTCPKRCVNPAHLRVATSKQNVENHAGPQRNNQCGVRGVTRHPNGRWRARVGCLHVGYFTSLDDANAAVIAKRLELHTYNDMDRERAS